MLYESENADNIRASDTSFEYTYNFIFYSLEFNCENAVPLSQRLICAAERCSTKITAVLTLKSVFTCSTIFLGQI